jgi:alkanesulfonate monooxygenase SsuD/methylene tetrahydromethanopterin reductase-like flavin-dependent oxidoreductase (luciferase family)
MTQLSVLDQVPIPRGSSAGAASRALSYAGDPGYVVERLHALADSVSADELLISTIVYAPEDRQTSYRLIAENWDK